MHTGAYERKLLMHIILICNGEVSELVTVHVTTFLVCVVLMPLPIQCNSTFVNRLRCMCACVIAFFLHIHVENVCIHACT